MHPPAWLAPWLFVCVGLGEQHPIVRTLADWPLLRLGDRDAPPARREPLPLAGRRPCCLGNPHLGADLALVGALGLPLPLGFLACAPQCVALAALEPVVPPAAHDRAPAGLAPAAPTSSAAAPAPTPGATATAAVVTPAAAFALGPGHFDFERATIEISSIELRYGLLGLLGR